jgi:hypothetical protein
MLRNLGQALATREHQEGSCLSANCIVQKGCLLGNPYAAGRIPLCVRTSSIGALAWSYRASGPAESRIHTLVDTAAKSPSRPAQRLSEDLYAPLVGKRKGRDYLHLLEGLWREGEAVGPRPSPPILVPCVFIPGCCARDGMLVAPGKYTLTQRSPCRYQSRGTCSPCPRIASHHSRCTSSIHM